MPNHPATLVSRRPVARGQAVLRLEVSAGVQATHRAVGQYASVVMPGGSGYFALCNRPGEPWELLVKERPGVASSLFQAAPGATFECSEAMGDGFDTRGLGPSSPVLVVAAGTGVGPVIPLLRALGGAGVDPWIRYGATDREAMPFLDEVRAFPRASLFVSREAAAPPPFLAGRVTTGLAEAALPWTLLVAFACGPASMVADLGDALVRLGTRRANIRVNA